MTAAARIDATYRNGEDAGLFAIVESLGGGIGSVDFDDDGRMDLLVPTGGQFSMPSAIRGLPSRLYRQIESGRFIEVADRARVTDSRFYSHGAAVSDIDGDGFEDALVTGFGGLRLFLNQGDGTFREAAVASGLTDMLWSSSAAFADFNADGHPDLYVAHYVNWSLENNPVCGASTPDARDVCPPRTFEPLPDTLYLNLGDGAFRDASREWGLRVDGKGLGVVAGDIDLDGRLDIYVGNDTVPNFLYRNLGTSFEDAGLMSGTSLSDRGTPDGSMGVDLGDLTNDGLPDLWASNYESESFAVYRNEGKCFFQPVSSSMGVTAVGALYVGWGTGFLDVENDGDMDVVVSNGHVIRRPKVAPLRQTPLLFENQGGRRFVNVAPSAGEYMASPHMGRGLALMDLDNDGDLDIVVSHTGEPVAVLQNDSEAGNNWLGLRLIGRRSPRIPIGAVVRVKLADGREMVHQTRSGSSYASSGDPRLFVGLGKADRVSGVSIRWPAGGVQAIDTLQLNQFHSIVEPID